MGSEMVHIILMSFISSRDLGYLPNIDFTCSELHNTLMRFCFIWNLLFRMGEA